jgi:hypothetical protein
MAFREAAGEVLADLLNELFADAPADSEQRRERLRAVNQALDRLEQAHNAEMPATPNEPDERQLDILDGVANDVVDVEHPPRREA